MPASLHDGIAVVVQRGGVDVHAADLAVADAYLIDVANAVGDELGVVVRMLAEDEDQPLVPLSFQGLDLAAHLVRVQRAAHGVLVRAAKRAVGAVVDALVADVQRREQHDAVAVDVRFSVRAASKISSIKSGSAQRVSSAVSSTESDSFARLFWMISRTRAGSGRHLAARIAVDLRR